MVTDILFSRVGESKTRGHKFKVRVEDLKRTFVAIFSHVG